MPLFNFVCKNKECDKYDVTVSKIMFGEITVPECEVCHSKMQQRISRTTHTIVGRTQNGRDPGKVIEEKNSSLKRKWSGYSHEEQNIRKDVTARAEEKLSQEKK